MTESDQAKLLYNFKRLFTERILRYEYYKAIYVLMDALSIPVKFPLYTNDELFLGFRETHLLYRCIYGFIFEIDDNSSIFHRNLIPDEYKLKNFKEGSIKQFLIEYSFYHNVNLVPVVKVSNSIFKLI